MSRIVCWFSCGAASAVATKLTLAKHPDAVVVRCVIREEHSDNDRFAADCEKWFGVPIVNLINEQFDGSIYKVFEKRKAMSFVTGAPCTMILKKQAREQFQRPDDHHVFGYTSDAKDAARWDSFLDANNIDASAPLIERGLLHSECLAIVKRAGIPLPTMYLLGYKHNNCIGCVKSSGQGYWNKIRIDFPAKFEHAAQLSRRLGCTLIKTGAGRIFLDELIPGTGNYQEESEIQCGVFCESAEKEISE
jgi:hypothetical protein